MAKAGRMVTQGAVGATRSHYCPECPAEEDGKLTPTQATMIMPGRRMVYNCKSGHTVLKGQTILR